jgi:hypothetical protein
VPTLTRITTAARITDTARVADAARLVAHILFILIHKAKIAISGIILRLSVLRALLRFVLYGLSSDYHCEILSHP